MTLNEVSNDHNYPILIIERGCLKITDAKVLIIEDNKDIRQTTAMMLDMIGYITYQTTSRDEAWELLRDNEPFDIILMDLTMDGMGLDEFLNRLAKRQLTPVIVFTSGMSETSIEPILDKPSYFFLSKPYGLEDLEMILEQI